MTLSTTPVPHRPATPGTASRMHVRRTQQGVVLIIALILLVIISLLAVTSLRNVGSAESVAGNVRTTEMARQSAEIALRHCELSVTSVVSSPAGTYTTSLTTANILAFTSPPAWSARDTTTNAMVNWDTTATSAYIVPLTMVNDAGLGASFKRPPECMVEQLPVLLPSGTAPDVSTSFVITARGFGPEVAAADASRSRPVGAEVWMQSTIQIQ